MNEWTPFYDYDYTPMQIKTLEWLFMMFSYNEDNPDEISPLFGERVRMFAGSQNRRQAEQNNGLALNKTPRQLYRLTLGKSPSYETEHHRVYTASWTGDIFLMLNWKYGIPHRELAGLDWNEIYRMGIMLSEASCVNGCGKIMERYGLTPRGDDPRMRF